MTEKPVCGEVRVGAVVELPDGSQRMHAHCHKARGHRGHHEFVYYLRSGDEVLADEVDAAQDEA